ncbi:hypothetical protein BKA93DRAFT_752546 [Sparassis latifolia]
MANIYAPWFAPLSSPTSLPSLYPTATSAWLHTQPRCLLDYPYSPHLTGICASEGRILVLDEETLDVAVYGRRRSAIDPSAPVRNDYSQKMSAPSLRAFVFSGLCMYSRIDSGAALSDQSDWCDSRTDPIHLSHSPAYPPWMCLRYRPYAVDIRGRFARQNQWAFLVIELLRTSIINALNPPSANMYLLDAPCRAEAERPFERIHPLNPPSHGECSPTTP